MTCENIVRHPGYPERFGRHHEVSRTHCAGSRRAGCAPPRAIRRSRSRGRPRGCSGCEEHRHDDHGGQHVGDREDMSPMRMRSESIQPPKKPANAPITMPMAAMMIVTRMPTDSEVPAPCTTREYTSQPWKVYPSGCPAEGPSFVELQVALEGVDRSEQVGERRDDDQQHDEDAGGPEHPATTEVAPRIEPQLLLRSLTRTASTGPEAALVCLGHIVRHAAGGVLSDIADPRVEHTVEQIDEQVDQDVDHDEHGHDRDDLRPIVLVDGP